MLWFSGGVLKCRGFKNGPADGVLVLLGKVTIQIKLKNWGDLELVATGKRKRAPRMVETEALVDTGAGQLYLQRALIEKLGLPPIGTATSRTMSNRTETRQVFSPVDL